MKVVIPLPVEMGAQAGLMRSSFEPACLC